MFKIIIILFSFVGSCTKSSEQHKNYDNKLKLNNPIYFLCRFTYQVDGHAEISINNFLKIQTTIFKLFLIFGWNNLNNIYFHRFMFQVDGHAERSMMDLAVLNTTYGEISRHVIWNDHRILPMQDWMLHYILWRHN